MPRIIRLLYCSEERNRDWYYSTKLTSRKGGDMAEWPEDLRIRQFPEVANA